MELCNALNSPDPLQYECPPPVHQDGTCNGLQHYAALGGDAQGARQVNLDVAERPSDVYTYVANMVEKRIEEDLQSNDARTRRYAELLHGKIARKVVKQTVRLSLSSFHCVELDELTRNGKGHDDRVRCHVHRCTRPD